MASLVEQAETPQLCSQCLGAQQTRLVRDSAGSECRLCAQPFVTYRWRRENVTKRTLICRPCATAKQACQSCILDLEFRISLALRDTALRIMLEEGGKDTDRGDVLRAVADEFTANTGSTAPAVAAQPSERASTLSAIVARFPLPGTPRPEACNTLCVYGIEADLEPDTLRAHFRAPIERVEYVVEGRYAFFTFARNMPAPPPTDPIVLDGRRLLFAWGERVAVPPSMQPAIGAVVRAFLRTQAHAATAQS